MILPGIRISYNGNMSDFSTVDPDEQPQPLYPDPKEILWPRTSPHLSFVPVISTSEYNVS